MKHAISVDVEEWFQVENMKKVIPRSQWDQLESRVERSVQLLLDLFARHRTQATFFVLGWIAQRHPEMVRRIAEAGHEVASHGPDHSMLYDLDRDGFLSLMKGQRELLEELSGQRVIGYRAPTFSITRRNWWVLELLPELGFRYDASVFPFKRERYGVAGAPLAPHRISFPNGKSLIELPPSVLRLGEKALPVAGGGYFRLWPFAFTAWAVERIAEEGRPFLFYCHPWEFDPDQPVPKGMPLKARLLHRLNLNKTYPRLEMLLKRFEFTTYADLATRTEP